MGNDKNKGIAASSADTAEKLTRLVIDIEDQPKDFRKRLNRYMGKQMLEHGRTPTIPALLVNLIDQGLKANNL